MPETYYRWVKEILATEDDFLPNGAAGKGRKLRGNPTEAQQEAWDKGLSMWDTSEVATRKAGVIHFKGGSYVVAVTLPDDHGLRVDGPTGEDLHHYTIYGEARQLLDWSSEPQKMEGSP